VHNLFTTVRLRDVILINATAERGKDPQVIVQEAALTVISRARCRGEWR
jgi:hypothetical protein